jgi:hypothetical protein
LLSDPTRTENGGEMSGERRLLSATLVLAGLCLVVLANLGLTVHAGHHALGVDHSATATQSLAGHTEPDPSLHMDSVSEVRTLTCPGCLLQNQIGGSRLSAGPGAELPTIVPGAALVAAEPVTSRSARSQTTRGPPSC